MKNFIINDICCGCPVDGIGEGYDTFDEAKEMVFKILDEDIKDCRIISKYEVFDVQQGKAVFHFAQDNTAHMKIRDLQENIKVIAARGILNPYELRRAAQLCEILAIKLEVAGF